MAEELPGPPHVKNNTGADMLAETVPTYEIALDAGAFRAVWETVEANAQRWPGTQSQAAFERAQRVFREAFWGRQEHLDGVRQRTPGKIVRTVKAPVTKQTARKN